MGFKIISILVVGSFLRGNFEWENYIYSAIHVCWWWYIGNLKNSSRNWTWFSSWRKFWRLKVFFAAAAPAVISDLQGPAIDLNSSKKTLIYNQITFLLPLFVSSFRFRKPWVSGKLVGMFSTLLLRNLQLSSPGMSVLPPLSSSNISISWLWNSLFSHLCHGKNWSCSVGMYYSEYGQAQHFLPQRHLTWQLSVNCELCLSSAPSL